MDEVPEISTLLHFVFEIFHLRGSMITQRRFDLKAITDELDSIYLTFVDLTNPRIIFRSSQEKVTTPRC